MTGYQNCGRQGRKIATLNRLIAEQTTWINEHGGTEAGYIQRYGSDKDDEFYGNGGESIYAADYANLKTLITKLHRALPKSARRPE